MSQGVKYVRKQEVTLRGQRVVLFDTIEVPKKCKLRLTFKTVNSEWRQGVRIGAMSARTDLRLTVAGRQSPGMQLWQDTCPRQVEIDCECPSETVAIYNIWDTGDGQSTSQTAGAGMHVELSPDGRTRVYNCNDGHPEPLFKSLVFQIETLTEKPS